MNSNGNTNGNGIPKRRLLRIKRAADYLGLSTRKIRCLVQEGDLHAVQLPGHAPWLLDIRDLDAWIEKNKGDYR